jgi:hypothetical protein
MSIMADAAAEVDRAKPVDERAGPHWDSPGEAWWEAFEDAVEAQVGERASAPTPLPAPSPTHLPRKLRPNRP